MLKYLIFFIFLSNQISGQDLFWQNCAEENSANIGSEVTDQSNIISAWGLVDGTLMQKFNPEGDLINSVRIGLIQGTLLPGSENEVYFLSTWGPLSIFDFSDSSIVELANISENFDYMAVRNVVKVGNDIFYNGDVSVDNKVIMFNGKLDLNTNDYTINEIDEEGSPYDLAVCETTGRMAEIRWYNRVNRLIISDSDGQVIHENVLDEQDENLIITGLYFENDDIYINGIINDQTGLNRISSIVSLIDLEGKTKWLQPFEASPGEMYSALYVMESINEKLYLSGKKGDPDFLNAYTVIMGKDQTIKYEMEFPTNDTLFFIAEFDLMETGKILLSGTKDLINSNNEGRAFVRLEKDVTSRVNEQKISLFEISPNPVTTTLNFNLEVLNHDSSISIYDMSGKMIEQWNGLIYGIDVSDYKQGMFILEIADENDKYIAKFLKM